MARNKRFLGCQYPLVKTARGILAQKTGVDQIKSDLLQLLLTNPGERCLTGDTLIPLADDTECLIKDLVGRSKFWVYSYDKESNSIVAGAATASKTVENAELLEITLDNNEKVKCTSNHLWMLRNGDYLSADKLNIGDSLMPLYRNFYKIISIKKLDNREDCYDLHVEKYHNFGLSAGVFVHNCMLPDYGTPLRKLMFEPNDIALVNQARNIIASSIKKWERRIELKNIEVSSNVDSNSLSRYDTQDEKEHILSVKIIFFDPIDITEIQELVLEVPLVSGS